MIQMWFNWTIKMTKWFKQIRAYLKKFKFILSGRESVCCDAHPTIKQQSLLRLWNWAQNWIIQMNRIHIDQIEMIHIDQIERHHNSLSGKVGL